MLFGLLVLVMFAMRFAAKPSTWNWMFMGQQSKTTQPNHTGRGINTAKSLPLKPGEFRARTTKASGSPLISPTPGSNVALKSKSNATAGTVDLTIADEHFALVEDDSYDVPFRELPGYYAILSRVAKLPQQSLRDVAKRHESVPFSVLLNEPKRYRGQLMTVEGKLGSLRALPDQRDDLGLKILYEAWIVTSDSDNRPFRVVFSELPVNLQPKDRFDKPPPQVRVTGYFFKIQRYEVQEGDDQDHRAPLILAKRIQVLNPSASQRRELGLAPYVIGFALALGAILAFTMWRLSAGDKQFAETQLKRFDTTNTADVTGLEHLDASDDPADFFRRLSESETAPQQAAPLPADPDDRTGAS